MASSNSSLEVRKRVAIVVVGSVGFTPRVRKFDLKLSNLFTIREVKTLICYELDRLNELQPKHLLVSLNGDELLNTARVQAAFTAAEKENTAPMLTVSIRVDRPQPDEAQRKEAISRARTLAAKVAEHAVQMAAAPAPAWMPDDSAVSSHAVSSHAVSKNAPAFKSRSKGLRSKWTTAQVQALARGIKMYGNDWVTIASEFKEDLGDKADRQKLGKKYSALQKSCANGWQRMKVGDDVPLDDSTKAELAQLFTQLSLGKHKSALQTTPLHPRKQRRANQASDEGGEDEEDSWGSAGSDSEK